MNHLLQSFAGLAVNCAQPDTETVARVPNESGNDRATIRFPADLESYILRDPAILRAVEAAEGSHGPYRRPED